MNKLSILLTFLLISTFSIAQKYEFTTIKDIEANPVISQGNTGTCWSFSTTSFLESEIIRITGKPIDLSEMFTVRNTYPKKGYNYFMRQGKAQFGEGGLAHDVINSAREFGLVPQSVYSGKMDGTDKFDHSKMEADLEALVKKAVETPKEMASTWKADFETILKKYMGDAISSFTYENKTYNPQEFLAFTKLNLDDYVTLTSFTNDAFYKKVILDIPDNFSYGSSYNIPLDEFIFTIDYAINKGFTIALDADVSEKTFSGKNGIAVIPENENDNLTILTQIMPEKNISQEFRQIEFENFNTTDDHLMHIVGKVKDQNGNIYYKVKNSWGTTSGKEGYIYMSVAYLKLKTISILLNKDGISPKTRNILKI
jgi:bleomycin hydrolase